jgi:flagellar motor protein MotB
MALYTLPADLLFDTGEAELRPSSVVVVEEVAKDITERFPGKPIIVRGHTDSVGGSPANRELSRLRAEAVADILIEEGGIEPDSMEIEAFGELDPRASNETAEGRAQNRRVEILIRTRR